MTSSNSAPTNNEISVLHDVRVSAHSAPATINISSIDFGERGRTNYDEIDVLAGSIQDVGLIEPVVVRPLDNDRWLLVAGGRRLTALQSLGVSQLWFGHSSDPSKPGYVIKHDRDTFTDICAEIAENEHRLDVDWRDKARLLAKAYRLAQTAANLRGESILMRDFGKALGVGYSNLQNAVTLDRELAVRPDLFSKCTSLREAYLLLIRENEKALLTELARRSQLPQAVVVKAPAEPERDDEPDVDSLDALLDARPTVTSETTSTVPALAVRLTDNFFNMSGLDYMRQAAAESFDHIITDPDYGVSVERLTASVTNASDGVAQASVDQTLLEFRSFFVEAFRITKPAAFVVLWCDLDHWEKLMALATEAGFRVQRWPIVWHKLDYRSNAAPGYNFTKNIEYAMVCRKPNATLTGLCPSSVVALPSESTTKFFNHPFAKPVPLWQFIYNAVAIKGQSVLDPFAGSGSACVAALRSGLRSYGCEINASHYANMLINLQTCYKSVFGQNLSFLA